MVNQVILTKEEILSLIFTKFGSQKECAEAIGVDETSLSRSLKTPTVKFLIKLKNAGVPVDLNKVLNKHDNDKEKPKYPFVEYRIAGVVPAGINDFFDRTDSYEFKRIDFDPEHYFWLEIDPETGESMKPFLNPRDMVLCTDKEKVKTGDLVAALYDSSKGAVKFYSEKRDMVILSSYNQIYQPLVFNKNEVKVYRVVLILKS